LTGAPVATDSRAGEWWTLALCGLALFCTVGAFGLLEPTETRYAEIGREMRHSGDWLTPRLNGLSHLHKPPLAYWAAAAGMTALGDNAAGARAGAAAAAFLVLVATGHAARRRFAALGQPPERVVVVLASMALFAVLGRGLAADPFLAAAVAGYWALAPSPWALAMLGLGFLAKGPVVFVHTLLPVLAVAALRRDRATLAWLGPARGWVLLLAIALPWYVVLAARTPGLIGYWLGNQIADRYLTTTHHRPGPPWYFAAVLMAGALPWTAAMVAGARRVWRERARVESLLLLAWLVVPLLFLSFSGSKLPAYLLPILPAVALLAARGLETPAVSRLTGWVLLALAVAAAVLGPRALAGATGLGNESAAALPVAAWIALGTTVGAALALLRGRLQLGALAMVAAYALLALATARYESALGSPRGVARLLAEHRARGEPVVEVSHFNAGLPFYLGETVRLLDVGREQRFDSPQRVAAVVVTPDSIAAHAAAGRRVWIFGPADRAQGLAVELGLDWVMMARWRKETLGFLSAGTSDTSAASLPRP
jgi:4-amino-4-deoxy-L-arabinose transferase-like glycosyltransferase